MISSGHDALSGLSILGIVSASGASGYDKSNGLATLRIVPVRHLIVMLISLLFCIDLTEFRYFSLLTLESVKVDMYMHRGCTTRPYITKC